MVVERNMRGKDPRDLVRLLRPRLIGAVWLLGGLFLILTYRLYTLQILRGEELSSRGRRNFVQRVEIPHDRGIIFDRHGRILVDNRPSLDAQVVPAFLGKGAAARHTLERLAQLVGLNAEESAALFETVKQHSGLSAFKPILVKRDLDAQQVEAVEAERGIFHLDGVDIREGRRRTYPYGTLAAHLLGYVNEIDPKALETERARDNPLNYESGDMTGRDGLERTYEEELRGVDGYEQIVVDAKGRRVRDTYIESLLGSLQKIAPQPGHNIFLTLDLELQQRAEEVFSGKAGAAVVLDVHTGAILAMVSKPAYDPNLVSGALAKETKQSLDADPLTPWLNRAIAGQYAPGSTFKVVTALAGLHAHVLNPKETVFCPGHFSLGRYTWRCHKDTGHGPVDLRAAIQKSCDTYFYTMGNRMGLDAMALQARLLGLGEKTGVPLRGERAGLVPDEAYHNRLEGYSRGMAINTAIGQGALLVTPLQLARSYAAVANNGQVLAPQLVERVESADFRVLHRFVPEGHTDVSQEVHGQGPSLLATAQTNVLRSLDTPESFMKLVQAGLAAVVGEPGGTAYSKRSQKVAIAGKTGTAQVVHLGTSRQTVDATDYFARDHAWFAAYAPVEDPRIAVVVLNEHAGHGGAMAAPIAVDIIEAFFDLQERRLESAAKQVLEPHP